MRIKPVNSVGFTLIEVLVALAIGGVVMTAVVAIFIMQNRSYDRQEQLTQMVQTARAAMDMMVREIRMAGHDPTGAGFDGVAYDPDSLQIRADLGGNHPCDPPDGDTDDPNECVRYTYDPGDLQIDRNTGGGNQPFAENIEAFVFDYRNSEGHPVAASSDIRQIALCITVRTDKPDPTYGANRGYRTYTLRSSVTPPNLPGP